MNVEAVLEEDEGCVGVLLGQGGEDQIDGCGGDVRDVFCGEDDEVVWVQVLLNDVGDGVADFEVGC